MSSFWTGAGLQRCEPSPARSPCLGGHVTSVPRYGCVLASLEPHGAGSFCQLESHPSKEQNFAGMAVISWWGVEFCGDGARGSGTNIMSILFNNMASTDHLITRQLSLSGWVIT